MTSGSPKCPKCGTATEVKYYEQVICHGVCANCGVEFCRSGVWKEKSK